VADLRGVDGRNKKKGGSYGNKKEKGEGGKETSKETAAVVGAGCIGRAGGFGPCIPIGKEVTHVRSKMEPR